MHDVGMGLFQEIEFLRKKNHELVVEVVARQAEVQSLKKENTELKLELEATLVELLEAQDAVG